MVANAESDDDLRRHSVAVPAPPRYGAVTHVTTAMRDDAPDQEAPPSLNRIGQPRNIVNDASHSDDAGPLDVRIILAVVGVFVALTAGAFAAASGALNAERLLAVSSWFETLGPSAVFLYAGLYFLLELIGVPALPLTMGSGYLFGVFKGTVAVSVASTAAAAVAFVIARYGLRNSVAKLAARYPRFRAMDRAIGRQGFKFVFLLRLSPLLPFALSNYLYGLTSVDLPAYVAGSWLGMLPGTIAYVSAGAAVSALTDLSAGKSSVNPGLIVLGLAATIAAISTVGKMATEAIEAGDEEEVAQN